jgi:hypothetical protein
MGATAIGHLPHGTKVVIKPTVDANVLGTSYTKLDSKTFYVGYVNRVVGLWVYIEHPNGWDTTMGQRQIILASYEVALCIKYVGDKK